MQSIREISAIDVKERARELGCNIPTSLAFLPRNFETAVTREQFVYEGSLATVRSLWRQAGLKETPLERPEERSSEVHERGFEEWVAPTMFFTLAALIGNEHLVSVAIGVLSNYLADFFRGIPGGGRVKLGIVIECSSGDFKKVEYVGPPSGLSEVASVLEALAKND